MAEIRGKLTASVTIDANADELFQALAKELKVGDLFRDERDICYTLDLDAENNPYIVRMENRCYHGSPHYEETARKEISIEEYHYAEALQKIKDTMREQALKSSKMKIK